MTRFSQKSIAVDLGPEISRGIDSQLSKVAANFITDVSPVWCPGCGDSRFLDTLRMVLAYLELDPDKTVLVSGIGCSGRTTGYVNTYGIHVIHGGPVPVAEGVALDNPELTVIVIGGDGDTLAIGGGFLPHAARRNVNIKLLLINNAIYGLTKGQASPTTVLRRTVTTPYGSVEDSQNPVDLALAYKATYIARIHPGDLSQKRLAFSVFVEALRHQGFALIDVQSSCSTFNTLDVGARVERGFVIGADHDVTDRVAATAMARELNRTYYGIFYQVQHSTLVDRLNANAKKAQAPTGGPITIELLFDQFA